MKPKVETETKPDAQRDSEDVVRAQIQQSTSELWATWSASHSSFHQSYTSYLFSSSSEDSTSNGGDTVKHLEKSQQGHHG